MVIRKQEAESKVYLDTVMWSSKVLDAEEDASFSWLGTSLFVSIQSSVAWTTPIYLHIIHLSIYR